MIQRAGGLRLLDETAFAIRVGDDFRTQNFDGAFPSIA